MSPYRFLVRWLGSRAANAIIVVTRAALIVLVVLLSDKGFTSFPYLQLGR